MTAAIQPGYLLVRGIHSPQFLVHSPLAPFDFVRHVPGGAKVIQVFKQRLSRKLRGKKRAPKEQLSLGFAGDDGLRRFWQRRYYDFNLYSRAKLIEKLHHMHSNPVRKGLVQHPGDWPWSSWCFYYRGEGLLKMDSWG